MGLKVIVNSASTAKLIVRIKSDHSGIESVTHPVLILEFSYNNIRLKWD